MKKNTFLYNFLMMPHYRWMRHLLVIIAVATITLDQVLFTVYGDLKEILGNYIWIVFLYVLFIYLITGYFNIYVLIPRYLLQKRYFQYGLLLFLLSIVMVIFQYGGEWVTHKLFNIKPGEYSYLNQEKYSWRIYIFEILNYIICLFGISMAIIFKHWIVENERIGYLEKIRIRSEVEQLKEQINPRFLFSILNYTGSIAAHHPEKASEMVMNLSRLLRYQLYDGSREKVLLSAEIQFLNNYLKLENLYSGQILYEITTTGDIHRTFILPLTFLPFVRYTVQQVYQGIIQVPIQIRVEVLHNTILFQVIVNDKDIFSGEDFTKLQQRLTLAYRDNYLLKTFSQSKKENEYILQLEINE